MKNTEIRAKTSKTCVERYGVVNPLCSDEIKQKSMQTCFNNYGVYHFSQSPLFSSFHRKRVFHDGIWFDSNWEVLVYDYLRENKIEFEYQPNVVLEFIYDETLCTYHPDFLVNERFYEVKGDHFFRINESGKEEMFCPYRNSDWTDEQYDWICGKFEAKHQCMLKNNVVILRCRDLDDLGAVFVNRCNERINK